MFEEIESIKYIYGSTNTADGLMIMRELMFSEENGDRPGVPNVAIVITDGISNIDAKRTIPEALKAHQKGIHVYAVGIGLTDTAEINEIATPPASKNRFTVKDFDELGDLRKAIYTSFCKGCYPTVHAPFTRIVHVNVVQQHT